MRLALMVVAAALPLLATAQAPEDCQALQAEVQTLRARIQVLEAANTPPLKQEAPLPGTAVKPAAKRVVVVEEPYSRSGCRQSLFEGAAPGKWQDADLWLDLEKDQLPAQVEALLGPEHYDEHGGGNVVWHYGKCGASSMAQVLFTNSRLADWRKPAH